MRANSSAWFAAAAGSTRPGVAAPPTVPACSPASRTGSWASASCARWPGANEGGLIGSRTDQSNSANRSGTMNLREPGSILLVSCYELGHQPLGAASPLGFLKRAGFNPATLDIAVDI